MSQIKPADFSLLLQVFRDGLLLGLISKQEVVNWADEIIIKEEEPDYFFIEVSTCGDKNRLFELLSAQSAASNSAIPSWVLLGIVYQKLVNEDLKVDRVISILNSINQHDKLTWFESSCIYSLDDDYCDIMYQTGEKYWIELTEKTIVFLVNYREFTLDNYDQWPEISQHLDKALTETDVTKGEYFKAWRQRDAEALVKADAVNKAWKKVEAKRKRKRYALLSIPIILIVVIVVINYHLMQGEASLSNIFDTHPYLLFLDVAGVYHVGRVGYFLVKRRR